MAQYLNLKVKGLYTYPNPFSEAPQGALLRARNIVIDRDSIGSTRRGNRVDAVPVEALPIVNTMVFYQDEIVYRDSDSNLHHKIPDGAITTYSTTIDPPVSGIIRFKEANRKLFMTSDDGIQQLEGVGTTDYSRAGMPRALGMSYTLIAGTVIADDTAVAYRVVWGTRDAFDFLVLGAPSQRTVIANTQGSDQDAVLTIPIPPGITESDFYQVYRSSASASASTVPNDELQLIQEANPTSAEITAGEITFTDITPEDLKRATLYTSPSQEGIAEANENPPSAQDMEVFKNHMFYGNTRLRQRVVITLLGVGSPNALQAGDTLTIEGIVYTYVTTEVVDTDILIFTTGTPSQNIDNTARQTVQRINENPTSTTNAYYVSGFNDLPGQFEIVDKDFEATLFNVISSRDVFDPSDVGSVSGLDSTNDDKVNRLYFSKQARPEAVPRGNFIDIGSEENEIERVIALRESLYVLKADGIFRIVGSDAVSFKVVLADNTTSLIAPESAVVHNNQLVMMSDQGIVAVSENGDVAILSRPIEGILELIRSPSFKNSFGVSYESDRKYILWTVDDNDTINTAYVFNSITKSWTTHQYMHIDENDADNPYSSVQITAQVTSPDDDKQYSFIRHGSTELWIERKDFELTDYHDGQLDVTVLVQDESDTLELDTQYAGAEGFVGAGFQQGDIVLQIKDVSEGTTGTVLHFGLDVIWSLTDASKILVPIDVILEWVPIDADNPGIIKWWRDFSFQFEDASFSDMNVAFKTDFGGSGDDTQSITPDLSSIGWGNFPHGEQEWGGIITEIDRQVLRILPTRNSVRGHWQQVTLFSKQANQKFGLAGISVMFDPVSSKFRGTSG